MGAAVCSANKNIDLDSVNLTKRNSSKPPNYDTKPVKRNSKEDVKSDKFKYVIVGFGVAGGYAAKKLADLGVGEFEVAIVGEEAAFGYERPALSKAYLFPPNSPAHPPARLPKFHTSVASGEPAQTEEWYQNRNWTCYLSTKVLAIDDKTKTLRCEGPNGEESLEYEKLIVCTGSKPIQLTVPGAALKSIFYIRSEADAASLVRKMERASGLRFADRKLAAPKPTSGIMQSHRRLDVEEARGFDAKIEEETPDSPVNNEVVVLGGGYLGVEVATAMTGWQFQVVHLVFHGKHILKDLPWTDKFRAKVEAEIVRRAPQLKLHPDTTVTEILPRAENAPAVGKVALSDKTEIETHILVAAIGAEPCGKELFNKSRASFVDDVTITVDDNLKAKSRHFDDIWICGELAMPECGVETARAMGKYAAESAFNDRMNLGKLPGFEVPYPFHYSRSFEFTTDPLSWYQTGKIQEDLEHHFCGENNECGVSGPFATFYHQKGSSKLCAAVTCGSSTDKEFQDSIRKMVESGTATVEEAVQCFDSIFIS